MKIDDNGVDDNGWTKIHHAAKNGKYEEIKALAERGINIHLKTHEGKNCLHIAAANGQSNLCKTLIFRHEFDINMIHNGGWTALHFSVQNGSHELVKFFTDQGADIHRKTNNGVTCLHIAAAHGHLNLCKTLKNKYEFNLHVTDDYGWKALHRSALSGSYDLVKFFADNGTDIYLKTREGMNCLHIAAAKAHLNLCKALMKIHNFKGDMADNYGWTALHRSALNGSYDLVKLFAENGTDIYLKTREGMNCLHFAASRAHLNLCKALMKKHNFKGDTADNYGWTALHRSAQNGNYDVVKFFADNGTDIFLKMEEGNDCLHIAALNGHLKLCEKLVAEHKFDMNMVDNLGWTALHHSARNGSYELIEFFIKMGADIHLKTNDGQNCFHIAARFEHLNLCKTLIDIHNFDVDMTNSMGWTVLHFSAQSGSHDLIDFFVKKGVNVLLETRAGNNSLHIAASNGHLSLCETLITKYKLDVKMTDNDGWTALSFAAENGSYELIEFFVEKKIGIYQKTNDGKNCLHIAASKGHFNLCKTLIEKINFNVHMVDNKKWTALHYAAQKGSYELMNYFIAKGTDVLLKTKDGLNCLHIAASNGHLNLCKTLINEINFDVNIADDEGRTALYCSAQSGNDELFGFIADKGTNIFLKTKGGQNCLHIAAGRGHFNLCKTLIEKINFNVHMVDNKKWAALHYAAQNGSYKLMKYFIAKGTDVLLKTEDGLNCLHIAACHGHLNLCKTLINEINFDVNIADDEGRTVLHCSAQGGNDELFGFIADKGTNIFLKTKGGQNCLHIAAGRGHFNLCKTLIEKINFNVHMVDNKKWAALHYAAQNGSYKLMKYFIAKGTDVLLKTEDGLNCLHIAACHGHLNLCKTLINEINFDVNIADDEGRTVLHCSAQGGNDELFGFIADKGTDVFLKTKGGQNCLHIASLSGDLNLYNILIGKYKFDVHMTDNRGWRALHFSAQSGKYKNVKLFADKKTDIYLKTKEGVNCLHIAAAHGHLNLCKTLIEEHTFDVHICDEYGWTALHYSVKNGNYEMIKFFIDMGSDIYLKVNDGSNCLHIAALHGHFNLSKMLLDNYNFDVHFANNEGVTALHFAAKNGNFELFLYLLDKGSDIYRKTKSMLNVLHFSSYSGHFDICEFVLKYFIKDYKDNNSRNQHALHSRFCASEVFYKYSAIFFHAMDADGNTYLHLAADGNQSNVCELLLKYDTGYINLCNKNDETARDIAKKKNHKDVLRSLKAHYDRTGTRFCVTY